MILRPPQRNQRHAGVALVIVLAFVVLITGLIVAYFARSVTGRQLSNSSAGQTKSAMLAQSASDIVISGFRQEIAAGSSPTPSPSPTYSYYVPLTPVNMVPVRFGTPAPVGTPAAEAIPNLVRRSVRGDAQGGTAPIPTPATASLASGINSESDASLNGRSINSTRWNSHYLIPRAVGTDDTVSKPDPALNFTSPDWVLMTRGGPEVEANMGTGAAAINNFQSDNRHYVIGRYAYAVYDEGGLLDMNVAGHPTPTSPAAATGFTSTQIARKGSLAMADLTLLPAPTSADSKAMLSQTTVDNIVGWRNYAAANPGGNYPNFTFNAGQAANWYTNFASNNTSGFLKAYGGPAGATGPTDQALLSRQQLLRLRGSIGFSAGALQYMGTFSRGLEQPSFIPAHILAGKNVSGQEAPNINAVGSTVPPAASAVDSYLGNNDAAGTGSGGVSGQDLINPSFLTIRVKQPFKRYDPNKTDAVINEPLVKYKFPLSRLREITYSATDSTPSITEPANFTSSNPTFPTANHIRDWFGLSRTDPSKPWTYNHGADHIMNLEDLRDISPSSQYPAREPDFAEMLKAAINCGSLGKGGPNLHNDQGNYQYVLDKTLDYQVLQVMANIIDQYDTDSFPTVIQIASALTASGIPIMRQFRGVEDLPYFYRYHPFSVVTRLPSPLLSKNDKVDWRATPTDASGNKTPPPSGGPVPPAVPAKVQTSTGVRAGSALADAGEAVFLYAPDVWNPHDANPALLGGNGPRPVRFRLTVVTQDPAAQTAVWNTGTVSKISGDWYSYIPPTASIPAVVKPLDTEGVTSFTFSDDGGKLYREPTLLWRGDAPTNSSIAKDSGSLAGPYTDANTAVPYYGAQIGKTPVSYVGKVDSTQYYGTVPSTGDATHQPTLASTDGNYIFQGSNLQPNQTVPTGAYVQYTFRLEYQDPNNSTNWIIYDEKYPDIHGLYPGPNLVVNKVDFPNNQWLNAYASHQIQTIAVGFDPRSARFGIGTQGDIESAGAPLAETIPAQYYNSSNSANNTSFGNSKFTIFVTQRPYSDRGNAVDYSNPGMTSDPGKEAQIRWFDGVGFSASNGQNGSALDYDGLLTQNDQNVTLLARDGSTVAHIYYEDADGLVRRAMGAFSYRDPLTSQVYNSGALPTSKTGTVTQYVDGLPEVLSTSFTSGSYGVGTPIAQSISRPIVLNRAFRSVAELGYVFSGSPWKQLDLSTPESGNTGLLDVFCINENSGDALAAGKVNLNTHQAPVLQALLSGATRDEIVNLPGHPTYSLPALTTAEAANVTSKLMGITSDTTNAWRGPLTNIGDLVGHYVAKASTSSATDLYQVNEPKTSTKYFYGGLSGALDGTVYTASTSPPTAKVERLRESAVRALSDSGQTRVWNLMIDMVAQTGRYSPNATALNQFSVDGESRVWVHVAIDRYTGEVIDKQIETVTE